MRKAQSSAPAQDSPAFQFRIKRASANGAVTARALRHASHQPGLLPLSSRSRSARFSARFQSSPVLAASFSCNWLKNERRRSETIFRAWFF